MPRARGTSRGSSTTRAGVLHAAGQALATCSLAPAAVHAGACIRPLPAHAARTHASSWFSCQSLIAIQALTCAVAAARSATCKARIVELNGRRRVFYFASQGLAPGEELTCAPLPAADS